MGSKRSKAEHNVEGVPEAELKKWRVADKAQCGKYKKRQRKDLTPEEIDAIIKATSEPFALHKDIAKRFRITHHLVGGLVKDSKKRPEKLEADRKKLETVHRENIRAQTLLYYKKYGQDIGDWRQTTGCSIL